MRFGAALKSKYRALGRLEKAFLLLVVLLLGAVSFPQGNRFTLILEAALIVIGMALLFRAARAGFRRAIWGLRNRLLVTYLFIAVVPVLLILTLAGIGEYAILTQLAVYFETSELRHRIQTLETVTETLVSADPRDREDILRAESRIQGQRFPGLAILLRDNGRFVTGGSDNTTEPAPEWRDSSGVLLRDRRYYLWSHRVQDGSRVTAIAPISRKFLSEMIPGFADVSLFDMVNEGKVTVTNEGGNLTHLSNTRDAAEHSLPPPISRLDVDVRWLSLIPVERWDRPGGKPESTLMLVHTRPSAVWNRVFDTKASWLEGFIPILLLAVSLLFLIVELIALVIGVSLTRSITRAVTNLYGGTQRVMEGDFAHRVQVFGRDQLADLTTSFNHMTGNLERLLAVAKEKERLQAELAIAKQVQEQLYPKETPNLKTLRLKAVCEPARMVSGDYYDYLCIAENRLALAIGDVAGKGISAALLMASIQAALRMELRSSLAQAAPGGPAHPVLTRSGKPSASVLVSDLNQQLYATTSPEKYATFYFGLYDEITSELTYTNAGHLPPILMRRGVARTLDVNGTVVGAFPFSKYAESKLTLESGDLLVCYTDGITEPENEYGEMFGEERLIEVLEKHYESDEGKIIASIVDAVREWSHAPEQEDDMTLLLMRKV